MDFSVRKAVKEDLANIARTHIKCFPGNFSTGLGEKLLVKYYLEFYNENPSLFYVCETPDGSMHGFVMGYIVGKTNAINNFMKNNRLAFFLSVAKRMILLDKLTWNKFKKTFFKEKTMLLDVKKEFDKTGQGDLLSVCVTDDLKGTGAAAALLNAYHIALTDIGCKLCFLSCETSNPRGLAFYKKSGYQVAEEYTDKIIFWKELD